MPPKKQQYRPAQFEANGNVAGRDLYINQTAAIMPEKQNLPLSIHILAEAAPEPLAINQLFEHIICTAPNETSLPFYMEIIPRKNMHIQLNVSAIHWSDYLDFYVLLRSPVNERTVTDLFSVFKLPHLQAQASGFNAVFTVWAFQAPNKEIYAAFTERTAEFQQRWPEFIGLCSSHYLQQGIPKQLSNDFVQEWKIEFHDVASLNSGQINRLCTFKKYVVGIKDIVVNVWTLVSSTIIMRTHFRYHRQLKTIVDAGDMTMTRWCGSCEQQRRVRYDTRGTGSQLRCRVCRKWT